MKNVEEETGRIDLSIIKSFREVKKGYTSFLDGDILFAKITPCMENGKIAIVDKLKNGIGFGSTEFHIIRLLHESFSKKYIFYYISQKEFRKNARRYMKGTAGQLRVSADYLREVLIPIPPINEQKRIVFKLEELFSKLDTGVEYLKKTQILLKQYRQSILKYAFEGKLTERWRIENKDRINNQLLSTFRREVLIQDFIYGKTDLVFPKEWSITTIEDLGTIDRGKSKHRPRNDPSLFNGIYPFIQTGEIRNSNGLIINYDKTYNEKGLKQSKLWPVNTLCITIAANIAETALLGIEACFPDSVVGFIANKDLCNPKYVHYYIMSIKDKIERVAPATAQKNINIQILKKIVIPTPSIDEQNKIVLLLEACFSIIDNIQNMIKIMLIKSDKIQKSILKNTFEGKLVPQDPNDEPASLLLEKIKQEKSNIFKPKAKLINRQTKLI